MPNNPEHFRMLAGLAVEEAQGKLVCAACETVFSRSQVWPIARKIIGSLQIALALTGAAIGNAHWAALYFVLFVPGLALILVRARCPSCHMRQAIATSSPRGRRLVLAGVEAPAPARSPAA